MYRLIISLLFLQTVSASSQTLIEHDIMVSSDDISIIQQTIDALALRLAYAGYDTQILATEAINVFRITTTLDTTSQIDTTLFYSQFENNTLDFRVALRKEDRIIRNLYNDLKAVDGLLMNMANDPSAIFLSRDPQLLDEQLAGLQDRIQALPDGHPYDQLQFRWAKKPKLINDNENGSFPAHILYAYSEESNYGLDESSIQQINVQRTVYGEEIHIQFTEDTAGAWIDMTAQAAREHSRSVLVILNEEIIDAQRIPNEVISGKGLIKGIRSRREAEDIAQKIRIGRLPVEVLILSPARLAE